DVELVDGGRNGLASGQGTVLGDGGPAGECRWGRGHRHGAERGDRCRRAHGRPELRTTEAPRWRPTGSSLWFRTRSRHRCPDRSLPARRDRARGPLIRGGRPASVRRDAVGEQRARDGPAGLIGGAGGDGAPSTSGVPLALLLPVGWSVFPGK